MSYKPQVAGSGLGEFASAVIIQEKRLDDADCVPIELSDQAKVQQAKEQTKVN